VPPMLLFWFFTHGWRSWMHNSSYSCTMFQNGSSVLWSGVGVMYNKLSFKWEQLAQNQFKSTLFKWVMEVQSPQCPPQGTLPMITAHCSMVKSTPISRLLLIGYIFFEPKAQKCMTYRLFYKHHQTIVCVCVKGRIWDSCNHHGKKF